MGLITYVIKFGNDISAALTVEYSRTLSVNRNKSKNKISLVTRPMVDHRAWPYSPPALTRHLTLTWPESMVSKHSNFLELMGEGLTHSTPTTNTTTHTPTNTTRTSRIETIDITKSCHEKVLRRTFPQGPGVSSNWKLPPLKCRLYSVPCAGFYHSQYGNYNSFAQLSNLWSMPVSKVFCHFHENQSRVKLKFETSQLNYFEVV